MLVFYFGKSVTVIMFISFAPPSFGCVCRNQSGKRLAFRMARFEDTHLTLAAILF